MAIYRACLKLLNSSNRQNLTIIRCVRNPARRGGGPKLLKGPVKSNDEPEGDEFSRITSYEDFMKFASKEDEIRIEKAMTSEEDLGAALGRENISEFDIRDEAFAKKKLIGQKYFKMYTLEANLLTCAAKQQIRHLHQSDPDQWTPETLSEHFPISVKGCRKLLKSYFALKDPDKIKQHDAEVEERWRALESRQPSKLITPLTRKLWNEGKLKKLNYKSNPNLPSSPPDDRKTIILDKPAKGEFSAIVQPYMKFKAKTEAKVDTSDGKEIMLNEEAKNKAKEKRANEFKFSTARYSMEDENRNPGYKKVSKKIDSFDDLDILHSQYKTNMKEEKPRKEITSNPQYAEWMKEQSKRGEPQTVKKASNAEVFIKIPKFKVTDDFNYSAISSEKIASNQKPRLQNRRYKTRNRNSPQNSSKNKGSFYREGESVYNEHGQFLYKVPFNV